MTATELKLIIAYKTVYQLVLSAQCQAKSSVLKALNNIQKVSLTFKKNFLALKFLQSNLVRER